ncbi:MAG: 5'-nucleotidase C-terminal domain-containing protein [Bradyrhizobium sp.]|jgi:5'-nucleotidase
MISTFIAFGPPTPYGDHVIDAAMSLNGRPIDPTLSYRVTVNDFLSAGGDGFTALKRGVAQHFGVYDVDPLYGYFQANSPIAPAPAERIVRMN